jgi:hypothetical protein
MNIAITGIDRDNMADLNAHESTSIEGTWLAPTSGATDANIIHAITGRMAVLGYGEKKFKISLFNLDGRSITSENPAEGSFIIR